jgi:hypothetical protein
MRGNTLTPQACLVSNILLLDAFIVLTMYNIERVGVSRTPRMSANNRMREKDSLHVELAQKWAVHLTRNQSGSSPLSSAFHTSKVEKPRTRRFHGCISLCWYWVLY